MLQHLDTIVPQPFARDPHHCLKHRHRNHAPSCRALTTNAPQYVASRLHCYRLLLLETSSSALRRSSTIRIVTRCGTIYLRRSFCASPPLPPLHPPLSTPVCTSRACSRRSARPASTAGPVSYTLQSRTTPAKPPSPVKTQHSPAICTPPPTHPLSTPRRCSSRRTLKFGPPAPPFST